jgi:hypothetical protein
MVLFSRDDADPNPKSSPRSPDASADLGRLDGDQCTR